MKRREFITLLGGAAGAWPLAASAQQPAMPVIGFLHYASRSEASHLVAKFRDGLSQSDFTEGLNVAIEYRWAEGHDDRLPSLAADLANRKVAAILAAGPAAALAVKATTSQIPTVFTSGTDPVQLGLVASFNRPGGNLTGVYIFATELEAKRLGLLHEMVPHTSRVAVLVNPTMATTASQLLEVRDAARALGLTLYVQNARSEHDFDAAFPRFVEQQAGALTVLSSGAVAWPLAARAQQSAGGVVRIGFLGSATAAGSANAIDELRTGLREFGYVEGRNIVIEFRWAEDKVR